MYPFLNEDRRVKRSPAEIKADPGTVDSLPVPYRSASIIYVDAIAVAKVYLLVAEDLGYSLKNFFVRVTVVRPKKPYGITGGNPDTLVQCIEDTVVRFADQGANALAVALQNLPGAIRGATVYHNDLRRFPYALRKNRF
jgi:hypothetical protein